MAESIDPEEARVPIASAELFVLDVRDADSWAEGAERLPGSTHIPAEELDSRLDELPDDIRILVVSPDGERSAEVAERLEQEGREAVCLAGGVEAWKQERLLTQPSPDAAPPKDEDEPPHEEPQEEPEGKEEPAQEPEGADEQVQEPEQPPQHEADEPDETG